MRDNVGLGLRCSPAVGLAALTTNNTPGCLGNGQNVFRSFNDLECQGGAGGS